MNLLLSFSRYFLAIPLFIFGITNFMQTDLMVGMVPTWLPGGIFWIYLVGICLIAAAFSILLGKKARLAATLVAVLMLVFVLTIYLPKVLGGDDTAMSGLLKDLLIAGGMLTHASSQSA